MQRSASKTWIRTLDPDPDIPGPLKIRTLKNIDSKNLNPEKQIPENME